MPSYQVVLQKRASQDLEDACLYAAQRAPLTAASWVNRFHDAIKTLQHDPERCPLAPENRKIKRAELREYLYGRRPNVFRAIYYIDGSTVRILRIRRAARRSLTRRKLDYAMDDSPNE